MFVDPDGMVYLAWRVFCWIGRALATQKGIEAVAAGVLAVAIYSEKFPTIDLPIRRGGTRSDVQ